MQRAAMAENHMWKGKYNNFFFLPSFAFLHRSFDISSSLSIRHTALLSCVLHDMVATVDMQGDPVRRLEC